MVNSCDSYSDCWEPFFRLLIHFWPTCHYSIVLNTEHKNYSFTELDLRASMVLNRQSQKTCAWADQLRMCLDGVETDLVLYMQEDYFLTAPVDAEAIQRAVDIMGSHDYAYVGLTEPGRRRPLHGSEHSELLEIDPRSPYRISTQAGIWRKNVLYSYLRPGENGWEGVAKYWWR